MYISSCKSKTILNNLYFYNTFPSKNGVKYVSRIAVRTIPIKQITNTLKYLLIIFLKLIYSLLNIAYIK